MIAALTLAVLPLPNLVANPVPELETVTVQALVNLPKLPDAERLCIRAAWSVLPKGSEEYSGVTIRNYAGQSGRPMVCRVAGDHLFLRVTFPKAQISIAFSMVESLLRRPLLSAEDLERALKDLQGVSSDPWAAMLDSEIWQEAKPSRDEVLAVFRKLVTPEATTLAVGGGFNPGSLGSELKRFEDWTRPRASGYVRPWAARPSMVLKSPGSVGMLELYGPEFSGGDAKFPVRLLAASALGVGRGAAIQRVAREQMGFSYRQEGFLQPTSGGFRTRILLAHGDGSQLSESFGPLKEALTAEIKKWTQSDALRAAEVIRTWVEDGIGICPIQLFPDGQVLASCEERTHFLGWWRMKFGREFSAAELMARLREVKLDDLKAEALAFVDSSSVRMLVPIG